MGRNLEKQTKRVKGSVFSSYSGCQKGLCHLDNILKTQNNDWWSIKCSWSDIAFLSVLNLKNQCYDYYWPLALGSTCAFPLLDFFSTSNHSSNSLWINCSWVICSMLCSAPCSWEARVETKRKVGWTDSFHVVRWNDHRNTNVKRFWILVGLLDA